MTFQDDGNGVEPFPGPSRVHCLVTANNRKNSRQSPHSREMRIQPERDPLRHLFTRVRTIVSPASPREAILPHKYVLISVCVEILLKDEERR